MNSSYLRFTNIKKTYDQKTLVVNNFNLDVAQGEFLTLLGPSGSGKSTVLMMMAGFESVTSGDILLNQQPITRMAPYKRNIGMVFQNYALFPHMTIAENLAYPLKVRKLDKAAIQTRVNEYLKLIELESFGNRTPAQLSGGQRQRVALARALIFEPSLVLMDEPLGALDKKLREQMQLEISRMHKKLGFTVIYVTHDQTEALTMSDRIAVFHHGVVQQCAEPATLYEKPANAFVADFIGENNFLPGEVVEVMENIAKVKLANGDVVEAMKGDCGDVGSHCIVSVRPEKLFIVNNKEERYSNSFHVRFMDTLYVGDFIRYFFVLPDGTEVVVKTLNDSAAPQFNSDELAVLSCSHEDCFAFTPSEH